MEQMGMGAMLHILGGGSEQDPKKYVGRTIVNAKFGGDEIILDFEGSVSIKITDDGQSCCESRYMTTSDDFSSLIGTKLRDIRVKEYKDVSKEDEYDSHQIAFLEIATDKLSVIVETHVEHNGYYGGFGLSIKEI